jgi:hypothetical protein
MILQLTIKIVNYLYIYTDVIYGMYVFKIAEEHCLSLITTQNFPKWYLKHCPKLHIYTAHTMLPKQQTRSLQLHAGMLVSLRLLCCPLRECHFHSNEHSPRD